MHRLLLLVGLLVTLAVSAHAIRIVEVGDNFFRDTVTLTHDTVINVGETVQWVWVGNRFHTVTSAAVNDQGLPVFDSGFKNAGTFEWTFNEVGLWEYYCIPHSSHQYGTVKVVPEPSALAAIALPALLLMRRRK